MTFYYLSKCSGIHLLKPTVLQLFQTIPPFYETLIFITMLTTGTQLLLSKPNKCTPHIPILYLLHPCYLHSPIYARVSEMASFKFPHQNPVSIYFTPNICRTSHPSDHPSNILSAVKIMKPFIMRTSPASCHFLLLTLMVVMITNMALPSDARIRNRSHISTSITLIIPTRGEKHTFHVQRNILASLLYLAIKSAALFP